jgi:hypothetical protein
MSQPSGMVCGFPSKHGFFLRSSPFICALDISYLLIQITIRGYRTPRKILEDITKRRFRDVPSEDEGGLSSLQKNAPFRFALFFLGAFRSIIKLFAYQGIPWTQAFGAMYLGSFLIIEILVIPTQKQLDRSSARRKEKVEDDVPSQPLITTADDDAAANQTEIELSFDHLEPSSAAPRTLPLWLSSVEDGIPRQPGSTSVAIPPSSRIEAWVLFLSRSFSYSVSYSCIYWVLINLTLDTKDQSDLTRILIVTFGYFTSAAAIFWAVPDHSTLFVDLLIWAHTLACVLFVLVLYYSYVVVICVSCIPTSVIIFYSLDWNLHKHLTKFLIAHKIEDISYWFFFLLNFIAAILSYWNIYNPASTIKPLWTNHLG